MAITFDPQKRPEDNLADFFAYLKNQDPELGGLLEARLQQGAELSASVRATIAKAAVSILKKRMAGGQNG